MHPVPYASWLCMLEHQHATFTSNGPNWIASPSLLSNIIVTRNCSAQVSGFLTIILSWRTKGLEWRHSFQDGARWWSCGHQTWKTWLFSTHQVFIFQRSGDRTIYRANTDSLHRLAIQTKLFIASGEMPLQQWIAAVLLREYCRAVDLFRPASGVCLECCMVCCGHGIVEIIATKRGLPTCSFCPSEMLTLIYIYIYIFFFPTHAAAATHLRNFSRLCEALSPGK